MIIITHNEEENIRDCLESVKSAAEIIVVDACSTDRTVEICRQYTNKIFQRKWTNFSDQKNFALSKATNEWVLSLDADERVTPQLRQEIQSAISNQQSAISGYYIPRKNYFLGKWIKHCGWWPDHQLRLFRKTKAFIPEKLVHESFRVKGKTKYLSSPLLHYSYKDIADHLKRIDSFSSLAAEQMLKDGKKGGFSQIVFRPLAKFFSMYILRMGFLDRGTGLIVSLLGTFSVFAKYAKLWELTRKKDFLTTDYTD